MSNFLTLTGQEDINGLGSTNNSLGEKTRFYVSDDGQIIDLENYFWYKRSLFIRNVKSEHSDFLTLLLFILQEELERVDSGKIQIDTLENMMCNLIVAMANKSVIAIHKNSNRYFNQKTYPMKHYSYRKMMHLLDILLRKKYIDQAPGFYNHNTYEGRASRIWPALRFIDVFISARKELRNTSSVSSQFLKVNEATCLKPDDNPIILRSDKLKLPVAYKMTPDLQQLKVQILAYNEMMARTSISYNPGNEESYNGRNGIIMYDHEDRNEYMMNTSISFDREVSRYYGSTLSFADNGSDKADYDWPVGRRIDELYETVADADYINDSGHIFIITNNNSYNLSINKRLDGYVHRVFNNGSFSMGGRFYGPEYQTIRKEYRSTIKINGNESAELDFSYLHFQMMYNLMGFQLSWDPYLFAGNDKKMRDLFKRASNIMINAPTRISAKKALTNYLNKHHESIELIRSYNLSVNDIINKFIPVHEPIRNFFNSGFGLKLQNYDSQIANNILYHFTRQGIPCLVIHDSFIVEQKYRDELEAIMKECYFQEFGYNCDVKVKKGV